MTARADYCVVAIADAFLGDDGILVSAIGDMPRFGAELARLTVAPDMIQTDGVSTLVRDGRPDGWLPYRRIFDLVWSGKRHVMMGATQIDRYGNSNIAWIGAGPAPKIQLLGMRGAPGNTICHPTSYWVPRQGKRVFVEAVDCVSGVGYDRAAELGPVAGRFHEIRRVVSDLGSFDFEGEESVMRLRSLHPGVSLDEVVAATGFELVVPAEVPATREPSAEELRLLDEVIDPEGQRHVIVGAPV